MRVQSVHKKTCRHSCRQVYIDGPKPMILSFSVYFQEAEFLYLVVCQICYGPAEFNLFSSVNNTCVRKQVMCTKKICSIAASF
jgi:hypothetical protein